MSEEVATDEVDKKITKKVVKKIIVRRIVKRKKKDVEGDNKSVEAKVATPETPEPIISEMKPSVKVNAVDRYVDSMDDMTRKAMEIAKDHLESSFNINKCNGYLDYRESTA
jgi:hypothetical protein